MTNINSARGFIALTITLIILLLVISVSIMTGKVLVGEQRVAANEMRYREALASAEGQMAQAMAAIASAGMPTLPIAGLPASVSVAVSTVQVGTRTMPLLTLTATDTAPEGDATVRQQVVVIPTIAGTPDAPLTLAGGMAVGGNFMVVANPNGGGPGVPLSIWTDSPVDLTNGSGTTCGQQEWADGTCSSSPYSEPGNLESDILANDPGFPDDLMQYVFGVEDNDRGMLTLEQRANAILTNCDGLNPSSRGLYIIDGTCNPKSIVGSRAKPVILLIRDGDLVMNGNLQIFGIVFSYDSHPDDATTYDLKMSGGATVWGSLISNHEVGNSNGTYNAVFDAESLQNIQSTPGNTTLYKVPGSWRDW